MTSARPRAGSWASAFWDERAATIGKDDPVLCGTVTDHPEAARLRDRLEKAHLARVVSFSRSSRVLDLGGGAGRFALWLAPRVAEVTLVDVSSGLLEVARIRAAAEGIANVRFVLASAVDFVPDRLYDVVLVMGVAAYLQDQEVERLAAVTRRAVAPGGVVVLKEPVSTDGRLRVDERRDSDGRLVYRAWFRPREAYPRLFGAGLELRYQRPTLAHLVPWFVDGTAEAVERFRGPLGRTALALATPLFERLDPHLLRLEEIVRNTRALRPLLAEIPVVQDLYVFAPSPLAAPSLGAADGTPELSVVVIAYDEEESVSPVVRELVQTLDRAEIPFELVLVDDGSRDATLARMETLAAQDPRIRVISQPNRGIGGALRTGFDAARGAFVTWIPADGQIPPDAVVELFSRRREATLLTTVYRRRDDPLYRHVLSQTLNAMIRLKTGEPAKSGGHYLFPRAAWQRYAPREDDTMMISTAFRQNLRAAGEPIVEVEIDCRARRAGRSKVLHPATLARTLLSLAGMSRRPSGRRR